jgi:hypothetical protein
VKKYNLPILVAISLLLVLIIADFFSVVKADTFTSIPDKENIYSDSTFGYPHTGTEICSFHTSAVSQANNGFKKLFGYVSYDIKRAYNCIFNSSSDCSSRYIFLKQYLSHIYPSHNFW